MNAIAHDFAIRGSREPDPVHSLGIEWELLLDTGARVAQLAGETDRGASGARELLGRIAGMAPAHRSLLEQQMTDLAGLMQPGMLTLEIVAAKGRNIRMAAAELWREFVDARDAILAMALRYP